MMTQHSLKSTLAKKVMDLNPAITSVTDGIKLQTTAERVPITVTLSITVPLTDAALYLKQLQNLMNTPNSADLPASPPQQQSTTLQSLPTEGLSAPVQAVEKSLVAAPDRLSDKQKNLIMALSKRKKVAAEKLAAILKDRFGVEDGTLLSKRQASQLIAFLMAN